MIRILIDEGAAFDMLSIAAIKVEANLDSIEADAIVTNLVTEIHSQIGYEKFKEIIKSSEFNTLSTINLTIYKMINEVKKNEIFGDASKIDWLNHERFLAKKAIQEKFFNNDLTEQKFGYNK